MSHEEMSEPLPAGERKEEIKQALLIMIVWTLAAIGAGVLLVLLRDPFASIFAMAGLLF